MRRTIVIIVAVLLLSACGIGSDSDQQATATPTAPPAETMTAQAVPAGPTPTATLPAHLTDAQLQQYKPNELGWVPILQFHHILPTPDQFTRTPEQFHDILQWLYDHNFYVINLHDFLDGIFDVPAGKHPVILTFDDGPVSQFRLIPQDNGQLQIDMTSAVGIMEQFFIDHPDFGHGGHFAILPDRTFAWSETDTAAQDQFRYAPQKLEWLLSKGYEIGNHTMDHANLAEIGPEEVEKQLAEANDMILQEAPDADIRVVTLPYGAYPNDGDDTVFRGFTYNGKEYSFDAVLLVGANPAVVPWSTEYDPYAIPRIQAFDEELDKWYTFIEENPGIIFTSDGNPDTVTIPDEVAWALADTLDDTQLGGRELIRYLSTTP